MMIATTGEMPIPYSTVADLDLCRTNHAGLSSRNALKLDQHTVWLRLSLLPSDGCILPPLFESPADESAEWHEEPDFVPGTVLMGRSAGSPDFSAVPDGIDWG